MKIVALIIFTFFINNQIVYSCVGSEKFNQRMTPTPLKTGYGQLFNVKTKKNEILPYLLVCNTNIKIRAFRTQLLKSGHCMVINEGAGDILYKCQAPPKIKGKKEKKGRDLCKGILIGGQLIQPQDISIGVGRMVQEKFPKEINLQINCESRIRDPQAHRTIGLKSGACVAVMEGDGQLHLYRCQSPPTKSVPKPQSDL